MAQNIYGGISYPNTSFVFDKIYNSYADAVAGCKAGDSVLVSRYVLIQYHPTIAYTFDDQIKIINNTLVTGDEKIWRDNHIKDAPKKISNVTFLTKAEDECLSVAVSSMISRYVFLKEMNKLEQEYGVTFPKGAGDIVDKTGKELVAKYGKDVLYKVSKLNFKNTTKILQQYLFLNLLKKL